MMRKFYGVAGQCSEQRFSLTDELNSLWLWMLTNALTGFSDCRKIRYSDEVMTLMQEIVSIILLYLDLFVFTFDPWPSSRYHSSLLGYERLAGPSLCA